MSKGMRLKARRAGLNLNGGELTDNEKKIIAAERHFRKRLNAAERRRKKRKEKFARELAIDYADNAHFKRRLKK